jgi:G3E family GTPase
MKFLILGGFLGSGKTSVLLQMAKYLVGDNPTASDSQVVILENEIGEVSVDDKVLRSGGYTVEGMFSGCVCCTMSGEMIITITNILRDLKPEYLIMEATGVAYPNKIKETIDQSSLDIRTKIAAVVDAKRWKRLQTPMGPFLKDQLENADVILINKIDLVDQETLDWVDESVKTLHVGNAKIFKTSAKEDVNQEIFSTLFDA